MIHLECDNDEALMLALGKARGELSHHAGKGRVAKALSLSLSRRSTDLGLIDQDPGQPPPRYLREFHVIERCSDLGLVRSRHPSEGKHLIEIQPDLEPWLYMIGPIVNIKPTDHHLPRDHSGLHQAAKKHRKNLIGYLRACLQANSPHLAKLAEWV